MNPALLLRLYALWSALSPEQKRQALAILKPGWPTDKLQAARDLDWEAVLALAEAGQAVPVGYVPPGIEGEVYARWIPIRDIRTDPARFQNRTDAFSEVSADSVEKFYDPNKFDPVVVWQDPRDKIIYILSGHSRYEGMRRRKEEFIPARFFQGDEEDAIVFARVDANRAAASENLIEDLKAYKLMRDGAPPRIKPATKTRLAQAFKGKHNKLESYSHLDPNGLFLKALQAENQSEFPSLQRIAAHVGRLRGEYGEAFTNVHERDVFWWLYSEKENHRMASDDFERLLRERLAIGKERLFPECDSFECKPIKDFAEVGPQREVYRKLLKADADLRRANERFKTNDPVLKLYTDNEKEVIRRIMVEFKEEIERIRRDLDILEKEPGLFGWGGASENNSEKEDFPHHSILQGPPQPDENGRYRYIVPLNQEQYGKELAELKDEKLVLLVEAAIDRFEKQEKLQMPFYRYLDADVSELRGGNFRIYVAHDNGPHWVILHVAKKDPKRQNAQIKRAATILRRASEGVEQRDRKNKRRD